MAKVARRAGFDKDAAASSRAFARNPGDVLIPGNVAMCRKEVPVVGGNRKSMLRGRDARSVGDDFLGQYATGTGVDRHEDNLRRGHPDNPVLSVDRDRSPGRARNA